MDTAELEEQCIVWILREDFVVPLMEMSGVN